jgi:hypothetical protein
MVYINNIWVCGFENSWFQVFLSSVFVVCHCFHSLFHSTDGLLSPKCNKDAIKTTFLVTVEQMLLSFMCLSFLAVCDVWLGYRLFFSMWHCWLFMVTHSYEGKFLFGKTFVAQKSMWKLSVLLFIIIGCELFIIIEWMTQLSDYVWWGES